MKILFRLLGVTALSTILFACSSQQLEDYRGTQPALDLKTFFDGELRAYGMLQNRAGEMTRRFTATMMPAGRVMQGYLKRNSFLMMVRSNIEHGT